MTRNHSRALPSKRFVCSNPSLDGPTGRRQHLHLDLRDIRQLSPDPLSALLGTILSVGPSRDPVIPEVFRDLQLSGLISGVYNGTSDLPRHAFGDVVVLSWVNPPGAGTAQHYLRFDNLPADVCLELDTKYDNSTWDTGSIVGNAAYTEGTTVGQLFILF